MNIARRIGIAIVATIAAAFLAAAPTTANSPVAGPGGCCPAKSIGTSENR